MTKLFVRPAQRFCKHICHRKTLVGWNGAWGPNTGPHRIICNILVCRANGLEHVLDQTARIKFILVFGNPFLDHWLTCNFAKFS